MSDTPQVLLQHHLRKLKLPTFQSGHAKLARQCAAEGKDHVQYLLRLCELELIERERRMVERRIKAASATGLGPVAASWRTPGHQEPRQLRLHGDPVPQQGPDHGTGAR
jgi:hypothetical protein